MCDETCNKFSGTVNQLSLLLLELFVISNPCSSSNGLMYNASEVRMSGLDFPQLIKVSQFWHCPLLKNEWSVCSKECIAFIDTFSDKCYDDTDFGTALVWNIDCHYF